MAPVATVRSGVASADKVRRHTVADSRRPLQFENKSFREHTPLSLVQFAPTAPKTGAIRGIFQESQKSPELKSVNKNTGFGNSLPLVCYISSAIINMTFGRLVGDFVAAACSGVVGKYVRAETTTATVNRHTTWAAIAVGEVSE